MLQTKPLLLCMVVLTCACGDTVQPRVIGAAPSAGDTEAQSIEIWVTGKNELGAPLLPAPESLAYSCEQVQCEEGDHQVIKGFSKGVYVLLVDASGSNEVATPDTCRGCPTDPQRKRVEAAKVFIRTMARFAPEWTGALMQFGSSASAGFTVTQNLSGYTADEQWLLASADGLSSEGGTYLWDSLDEVLDSLTMEAQQRFPGEEQVGRRLIVISDGEDTHSTHRLADVAAKAASLGVQIQVVGFSSAPPESCVLAMPEVAVRELREVARRTGGLSSIVSADELPRLFGNLARASVVGAVHQTLQVRAPPEGMLVLLGMVESDGVEAEEPFAIEIPNLR